MPVARPTSSMHAETLMTSAGHNCCWLLSGLPCAPLSAFICLPLALYFGCESGGLFRTPSVSSSKFSSLIADAGWVVTLLLAGLVELSPLGTFTNVKKHVPYSRPCNLCKNLRKNYRHAMDSGVGLGHLPGHRICGTPRFSNRNADTMSCLQQHKSNREELSAIDGGVGGWIKDKNKETHEKKLGRQLFFCLCLVQQFPEKA